VRGFLPNYEVRVPVARRSLDSDARFARTVEPIAGGTTSWCYWKRTFTRRQILSLWECPTQLFEETQTL